MSPWHAYSYMHLTAEAWKCMDWVNIYLNQCWLIVQTIMYKKVFFFSQENIPANIACEMSTSANLLFRPSAKNWHHNSSVFFFLFFLSFFFFVFQGDEPENVVSMKCQPFGSGRNILICDKSDDILDLSSALHRFRHYLSYVTWSCCTGTFNSLWPSDAIWRCRSGSTLAQVMACCLTTPAISWINVDLSSVRSNDIHLRARYLSYLTLIIASKLLL